MVGLYIVFIQGHRGTMDNYCKKSLIRRNNWLKFHIGTIIIKFSPVLEYNLSATNIYIMLDQNVCFTIIITYKRSNIGGWSMRKTSKVTFKQNKINTDSDSLVIWTERHTLTHCRSLMPAVAPRYTGVTWCFSLGMSLIAWSRHASKLFPAAPCWPA